MPQAETRHDKKDKKSGKTTFLSDFFPDTPHYRAKTVRSSEAAIRCKGLL
jgi:hypothetical protein